MLTFRSLVISHTEHLSREVIWEHPFMRSRAGEATWVAIFAGQRIAVSAILVRVCENSCAIPPTEMSCPAVSSITRGSDERPAGSAGRKKALSHGAFSRRGSGGELHPWLLSLEVHQSSVLEYQGFYQRDAKEGAMIATGVLEMVP